MIWNYTSQKLGKDYWAMINTLTLDTPTFRVRGCVEGNVITGALSHTVKYSVRCLVFSRWQLFSEAGKIHNVLTMTMRSPGASLPSSKAAPFFSTLFTATPYTMRLLSCWPSSENPRPSSFFFRIIVSAFS